MQIPKEIIEIRGKMLNGGHLLSNAIWIPLNHFDAYAWEYLPLGKSKSKVIACVANPPDISFDKTDFLQLERELCYVIGLDGEEWSFDRERNEMK